VNVTTAGKHVLLQAAGWILVAVGLAALVLPGPGLLALFAGMAVLATQYEWADRRLAPVKDAALRGATDSVRTWPRITLSALGAVTLIGVGVYWGVSVPAPSWWPVDEQWWLVGGWGTGATLIGSGLIVCGMLVYSYLHFREAAEDEQAREAAPSYRTR
jgi:hypothetical protein